MQFKPPARQAKAATSKGAAGAKATGKRPRGHAAARGDEDDVVVEASEDDEMD
jgi:hypothetical protein